jgi:glycosyltransferase involved in cell wall biosynthesis
VPERTLGPGEARALDLHTLAGALRSPLRLRRLLGGERYSEVRVREGGLPLSALQAACLVAVGTMRTRRFVVDGRELGRSIFLLRALSRAAVAGPSELLRSAVLARYVLHAARRRVHLTRNADSPRKALCLRVEPTLRWRGEQVGGAATHTSGVINGLIDNGVEVDVLAAERPLYTERARFVQVPVRRVLHLIPGLTYAAYAQELTRAGADLSTDFVYQRYQLGSDAGLALAERLAVPLVLEFNGSDIWMERHWKSGRVPFAAALSQLERRNLVDASLVVVVSKALRAFAIAQGVDSERVLVNPNGVDVDALAPYREGSPAQWRARVGIPDEPTVGFIGTFGLWHGVKLLPALVQGVPEARWVVVGAGDLFPEVRAEMAARGLRDRVLMTGLVDWSRALGMLACCDVCVSPHVPNPDGTPFFGSPTKLFEYMGLRKPIVASDLDQIGEILEHERTALLFRPGDVQDASAAIRRLLSDTPLRDRLADAAFELAATEYSWKAHARRIIDALVGGATPASGSNVGTVDA